MAPLQLQPLLSWLFSLFFFLHLVQTTAQNCSETSCGDLAIKFPFQLIGTSPPSCGYPDFGLFCNGKNRTLVTIGSVRYVVEDIDYGIQALQINDEHSCLPKQYLKGMSFSGSPFLPDYFLSFTFYNCSSNATFPSDNRHGLIGCLSDENNKVLALPAMFDSESRLPSNSCEATATVSVPVTGFSSDLEDSLQVMWSTPSCQLCEMRGQACGLKNNYTSEVECSSDPSGSSGLSTGAKYGIIMGVGIPGTLCIIGLGWLLRRRARNDNQRRQRNAELSSSIAQPQRAVMVTGLDGPTIESYPKTLLGESGRLPKPNDNTCPICLSEYQPKETLRTIPECQHYFHADCVDEWLKMNATCPLCRNSPENPAGIPSSTPTSSRSSGSPPSTSTSSRSSTGLLP